LFKIIMARKNMKKKKKKKKKINLFTLFST
jgi:hypothetical protein